VGPICQQRATQTCAGLAACNSNIMLPHDVGVERAQLNGATLCLDPLCLTHGTVYEVGFDTKALAMISQVTYACSA
jgi:hypothetical protein